MRVPLTVSDFLDRAALVYGERVGIVDEPDQPAESLGELTYARVHELARAQAAALDEHGIGAGERVAIVSHNAARLLVSLFGVEWLRPDPRPDQLPPQPRRGAVHRRAQRRIHVARRSRARGLARAASTRSTATSSVPMPTATCSGSERSPSRGRPTRTRPRRSTTRAARPRAPRASSSRTATCGSTRRRSVGTRGSTTATCTCTRCRCSTATAGGCPSGSPGWARSRSCCARSTGRRSCAGSTGTA